MARFERILLTGGSGFVGSYLCEALAEIYPKAQRTVLTRPGEPFARADWKSISADLLDEAAIDAAVRESKPDLVVHLAGQASIGQALAAAERTWRVNFHGSFNLATALARHVPRTTILFSSSSSVYGDSLRSGPADETTPLRPLDAYGRSKVAAEGALRDILGQDSRVIIVRPVNHSGPRQVSDSFVLASFAAQIAGIESGRLEPRLNVGDLSKARDFLDVRDVVDAYLLLIRGCREALMQAFAFSMSPPASRKRFNPCWIDCAAARRVRSRRRLTKAACVPANADIPVISCDASRLRAATDWRPRRSIDDMLQSLLDYWREVESMRR